MRIFLHFFLNLMVNLSKSNRKFEKYFIFTSSWIYLTAFAEIFNFVQNVWFSTGFQQNPIASRVGKVKRFPPFAIYKYFGGNHYVFPTLHFTKFSNFFKIGLCGILLFCLQTCDFMVHFCIKIFILCPKVVPTVRFHARNLTRLKIAKT